MVWTKKQKKEYARKYYLKNKDKLKSNSKKWKLDNPKEHLKHSNKWKKFNRAKVNKSRIEWLKVNRKYFNKYMREYFKKYYQIEEHKNKLEKRRYAYNHLRKEILRDKGFKCEECGSKNSLELHHIKYTKNKDDIKLICRKCHKKKACLK